MAIGADIEEADQFAVPGQQSATPPRGSDLQWLQTVSRRVGWVLVGVALVVGAVVVGVWSDVGGDTSTSRSDVAATARLEQLAEQYELARQARSTSASAARYMGIAEQALAARRNAAATARLDAAAQHHTAREASRRARSQAAASDRLTRLAEAIAGS